MHSYALLILSGLSPMVPFCTTWYVTSFSDILASSKAASRGDVREELACGTSSKKLLNNTAVPHELDFSRYGTVIRHGYKNDCTVAISDLDVRSSRWCHAKRAWQESRCVVDGLVFALLTMHCNANLIRLSPSRPSRIPPTASLAPRLLFFSGNMIEQLPHPLSADVVSTVTLTTVRASGPNRQVRPQNCACRCTSRRRPVSVNNILVSVGLEFF